MSKEVEKSKNNQKTIDKKEIIMKIINIALVIIWMIIVFCFSHEVGESSKDTSGDTIREIVTVINEDMTPKEVDETVELLQPSVRKLAHYTLYTIGGFLIYNLFSRSKMGQKRKIIYSLMIGIVYSISDEIHQLFVVDRTGRIFDVFVDSLGVITGIVIYLGIKKLIQICENKMK